MKNDQTLLSIQYLRFIASALVVVAHVGWTPELWGQQGVDIFFVISGFIMVHVARREAQPGTFLWARAMRVVPLYWIVTLAWFALKPSGAAHLALSLAFIPHLGPQGTIWPVIWQGWTLLYEAWFYVAFAAALALPATKRRPILTAAFGLLACLGWATGDASAFGQVYLSPLPLEFLAGAWLHRAWARGWVDRPAAGLAAALAGCAALVLLRDVNPGGWRVLADGGPALFIVGGGLAMERRLPVLRAGLLLGNASYAIYLTHRFIVPLVIPAAKALPLPLALSAVIGACTLIGIATHLFVETPIARALRGWVRGVNVPVVVRAG
jgi:exopolysaccharide production protein ExoZ